MGGSAVERGWCPPLNTSPPLSYTFNAHDADVILRAPLGQGSDRFKYFRVHESSSSVAPTLFLDTLSFPQPPQPATGGTTLPTTPVAESTEAFETFLRLIYPIEVDDLFRLAENCMTNASVHADLRRVQMSPSFFSPSSRDNLIWIHVAKTSPRKQNWRPHTYPKSMPLETPLVLIHKR